MGRWAGRVLRHSADAACPVALGTAQVATAPAQWLGFCQAHCQCREARALQAMCAGHVPAMQAAAAAAAAAAPGPAEFDFGSGSSLLEPGMVAAALLPAAADASLLAPLEAALSRLPKVRASLSYQSCSVASSWPTPHRLHAIIKCLHVCLKPGCRIALCRAALLAGCSSCCGSSRKPDQAV